MNSVSRSKKLDFVETGWVSLHESVLLIGAEVDREIFFGDDDMFSKRWLDLDRYALLLKPIINATDIVIQSPIDDADLVGKEIWNRLREQKKQFGIPTDSFARTSLFGFVAKYNDWIKKQLDGQTLRISQTDPLGAATIGWALVQRGAERKTLLEHLFWGLGILGWVAAIYSQMQICRYCFRWSVPGSPFCFAHTQSMTNIGDGGQAFARYRTGAKTLAMAQELGVRIQHKPSLVNKMVWRTVLAEYLFFNIPSEMDGVFLRRTLLESPRVLRLLGGKKVLSLSDIHLYHRVREKINPMELFPTILICTVPLAENLLSLEEMRKPGRPSGKRTKKTAMMIDKAKLMFTGGAIPSEVAAKLNVTRSTVSNWIRRYDDVRCAYLTQGKLL